jgi:hypothetical protein
MGHSLFVQEKLDDARFVEDEGQAPHNQEENQKPEPDVDGFSLLRLLRIRMVIRRVIPPQFLVSQIAAFLQTQQTIIRVSGLESQRLFPTFFPALLIKSVLKTKKAPLL